MKTKIIFIGGVPGIGKTTLSYQLALHYHIDKVISLDVIKEAAKIFIPNIDDPYLNSTTHESYKIENISAIAGFVKHCEHVQRYLLEILPQFSNDNIIIIEGAQLTADIINKIDREKIIPIYFNLYCHSKEFLLDRYEQKNKIRHYNWSENIENIWSIHQYLLTAISTIGKDKEYIHHIFAEDSPLEKMENIIDVYIS